MSMHIPSWQQQLSAEGAWEAGCFLLLFTTLFDSGSRLQPWQICWIAQRTAFENYYHWVPPQTCSENEAQTCFNKVSKEL